MVNTIDMRDEYTTQGNGYRQVVIEENKPPISRRVYIGGCMIVCVFLIFLFAIILVIVLPRSRCCDNIPRWSID